MRISELKKGEICTHIMKVLRDHHADNLVKGLTYEDLAKKINVTGTTIRRWFSMETPNLTIEQIEDIEEGLGIKLITIVPVEILEEISI